MNSSYHRSINTNRYRIRHWLALVSSMVLATCISIVGPVRNASAETSGSTPGRGLAIETVEKKAVTPSGSGQYRALVIGNNKYSDADAKWQSLSTAATDARAVADLLVGQYGFSDVELLENATRRDVLFALQDLASRSLDDDNVLIYYAGHGFMDEETNKGYWVPVDARGTDHTTFLRNSTIRDEVTTIASRVKHTLLISDSCFSGSLLRSSTRSMNETDYTEKYFEKVANKKSVQIMAAGGLEYVDDDYRDSGHSPFTYFLLNELKTNNDPMFTVSQLSSSVERAVANNVEQVPESGVLQGAGDELGEFIFIKLDVEVEGVDPDRVKVKVDVKAADGGNAGENADVIRMDKAPGKEGAVSPADKVIPIPTL